MYKFIKRPIWSFVYNNKLYVVVNSKWCSFTFEDGILDRFQIVSGIINHVDGSAIYDHECKKYFHIIEYTKLDRLGYYSEVIELDLIYWKFE